MEVEFNEFKVLKEPAEFPHETAVEIGIVLILCHVDKIEVTTKKPCTNVTSADVP
jgi:hypothetical protein